MAPFMSKRSRNDDQQDQADYTETSNNDQNAYGENPVSTDAHDEWLEDDNEGQLSVDVFQDKGSIIVRSTVAGVNPEDIDISIENDMLTVRGERRMEEEIHDEDYFYQECYWGSFSRSIILPVEVRAEEVEATLKNGVLTIKLPKAQKSKNISVKVRTE